MSDAEKMLDACPNAEWRLIFALNRFDGLWCPSEHHAEQAEPGAEYVINRNRGGNANLRTQFKRIVKRAGLKPGPRLFHNLRASRQTELTASFPLHVVCEWLGNTAAVASKHYLTVTEADCQLAATSKVAQNAAQSAHAKGSTGPHAKQAPMKKSPVLQGLAVQCEGTPSARVPRTGVEPVLPA